MLPTARVGFVIAVVSAWSAQAEVILGLGPLFSLGGPVEPHSKVLEGGVGGEFTVNGAQLPLSLTGGLFAQAEAVDFRRLRIDAGGQVSWSRLLGVELGGGYVGSDGTHASALTLHLAPYFALPIAQLGEGSLIDSGPKPWGIIATTVALRIDVPVVALDARPQAPPDAEAVLTIKIVRL